MADNDMIGFLKAGKYRIPILNLIKSSFIIPNEIAKKLGVSLPQVSRTLSELVNFGLIACTTPNRNIGRIYRITKNGRVTLAMLEEN